MKYKKPKMEIVKIKLNDVICSSPTLNDKGTNVDNENIYEDSGYEWT